MSSQTFSNAGSTLSLSQDQVNAMVLAANISPAPAGLSNPEVAAAQANMHASAIQEAASLTSLAASDYMTSWENTANAILSGKSPDGTAAPPMTAAWIAVCVNGWTYTVQAVAPEPPSELFSAPAGSVLLPCCAPGPLPTVPSGPAASAFEEG